MNNFKYVAYDYEEPGHWHIYTIDTDKGSLDGQATLLTIKAPRSDKMCKAVEVICSAIDAAVEVAEMET